VQKFLQRWKIPSSVRRGGSLADSLALQALKEIVTAVYDPAALKKALLGPLIQMGISDVTDEVFFAARTTFAIFREILEEKGFIPFFAAFLKSPWLGESVLEKLVVEEGLTLYHDLNTVADLIAEKAGQHTDLAQLLFYFEELQESETEDRVSGSSHGIQIMTTHASKGLEFDTVFALGISARTQVGEESDAELQELDAEKMRQFYVALTRAKTRVYVAVARDLEQKPVALGCASPVELFFTRVTPDLSQFPHTLLNEQTFHLQEFTASEEIALQPPLLVSSITSSEVLQSFSGLSHKAPQKISPPEGILPPGSETGVVLHRIFEKALLAPVNIAEELSGTHLQGWEVQVQEIVDRVLALPLLDFPRDRMLQEMEFLFPTKEGLIKGFIDLCFEKGGKYYLVDWKTNWLEDYSPESLQKAMEEGDYFLQASIYATALKRYLALYDSRPFEECFGGAYYIFVREPAVYHFYPEVL
jgi:exodeoxyribonuclease V beta subunit